MKMKAKYKMSVKEKIYMDVEGLIKNGPINIVILGDSISHGCFLDEIDFNSAYWSLLRKKIIGIKNYVPVNIINCAIGGITASTALEFVESRATVYSPDLIIICFGLNDVNGTLECYLSALSTIFEKCIASGAEVIFMTPNMLNTYVADDTLEKHIEYAAMTCEFQNSGKMDEFIYSAIKLAEDRGVEVCDCYSKWKELNKIQDTTQLLINRINHPNKKMHEMFADELFKVIFGEDAIILSNKTENTMYEEFN